MMENSQDVLWAAVGPGWWTGYAVVCGFSAVLWFRFILLSHDRDALTVARLVMLGGFILGAFVRMNSACQPLSSALLVTGGAMSAVLISVNWCGRRGRPWDKVLAILRDGIWGPVREYVPPRRR